MRFRPFPKLPRGATHDGTGGPWIALEKLHGAQLVVGVDADSIRFGKRKAWLRDDDPFFGWRLIANEVAERARALARAAGAPQVTIYGELCGGAYPHPDVDAIEGIGPVQVGVFYAADLVWVPFDVLLTQDDADQGVLASFTDLSAWASTADLILPDVLARGPRAAMAAVELPFDTRLPARLGLPPLDGNVAEGIVARPDRTMAADSRPAYKRKLARFDDAAYLASAPFDPTLSEAALVAWGVRLVGPSRVASARSKVGIDPQHIIEEIVLDVGIDLEATFPAAVAAADVDALFAAIRRAARRAVGSL